MRQRARAQLLAAALVASLASGAGCSRQSEHAAPATTAAAKPEPTQGSLAQVALPDLDSVATPVRQQIRSANDALSRSLADASAPDPARAQRYGELGNLMLAATKPV